MSDTTDTNPIAASRAADEAQSVDLGDLFAAIPIDVSLRRAAATGTPLSASKARTLVEQILSNGLDQGEAKQVARTLAEQIVQAIPEKALLTPELLDSIDYRVYVQKAIDSGWTGSTTTGDLQQVTLAQFRATGLSSLMTKLQDDAAQLVGNQADVANVSDSARQEATAKAQTVPTTITLSPEAVLQVTAPDGPVIAPSTTPTGQVTDPEGQAQADTAFSAMFDPNDPLFTQQQAKPTFPEDDYRQLVDMGLQSFVDVINAEQQYNADNKTTGMQTGINYEPAPMRGVDVPGSNPRPGRRLSLTSALDLPNTLGYEQVAELQQKLAMAGYFDQLGQGYREGDPDDKATQEAWSNALADVYRLQKDEPQTGVVQFLARKAVTYRDEVAKRAADRFMPLDNDTVRANADAAAVNLVGRRLTEQEYQGVRDYLVGLQKNRADDVIGVDRMDWASSNEAVQQGFTTDDINNRIMKDFKGEAESNATWDVGQKIYDAFGLDFKAAVDQHNATKGGVNAN